jgi:catechol 2,3-dioxygenase-like lactoylglutathione lyase family enzyme
MATIFYVDVDDTLVRTIGTKRIPIPGCVAAIRKLAQEDNQLFLWSSGGAAYAEASARELGIEACFVAFLPKPQVVIDDQPLPEWRQLEHRYPLNADTATRPSAARPSHPLFHHASLAVSDLARSAAFYDALLEPLGLVRVWEQHDTDELTGRGGVGYGLSGQGDWLALKRIPNDPKPVASSAGTHLAFAVADEAALSRAYAGALAHGGTDNGAPGPRPAYGADYFAAFVVDPDGHRLELILAG